MVDETPPAIQGPTSKERKYDRQLRLWAANGQAALEEANVLLLNSGPGVAGTEALKNLILPGIGRFTILDSAIVDEADLGINFFLTDDDLGAPRAERTTKWLQELNPDVSGDFVVETFETFVSQPDALTPFTMILVTLPVAPDVVSVISNHCALSSVPAFYIHSIGYFSHFSVQLPPAFPIVDTHPDPASISDLRLLEPWPELTAFLEEKTRNIESMDDEEHGHIPYILLLLYYLKTWRAAHDGKAPQNYREKSDFRDLVRSNARTNNSEGGEENFDEAIGAALKSLNPVEPSSSVKEVFAAEECKSLSNTSSDFWVISNAINTFFRKHGVLPLSGTIPDMKAKSADYISLQNIYKMKARADVEEVASYVKELEAQLNRSAGAVPRKEIEAFCKSCNHIKLVRGRPPHLSRFNPAQAIQWKDRAKFAAMQLQMPDSLLQLYIAFLAYDAYAAAHAQELAQTTMHAAGETTNTNGAISADEDIEVATDKMIGIALKLVDELLKEADEFLEEPEYSEVKNSTSKYVQEIARANGAELHNIAAVTGGIVAQECIKVITKQYVPVDNTCIFDGIHSKTSVLRL